MLALALLLAAAPLAAPPPLLPRELLLGNPERVAPKVSPDGKRLGWLAPDASGVLQVWVQPLPSGEAKAVTREEKRPVRRWDWAEDDQTLLYLQDQAGDENFHLFAVDLATQNVRDLTPWQGVKADLVATSAKTPDQVVVTMNLRDRKAFDVHRVSLKTGAVELDTQNPGDVMEWTVDPAFVVRGATASTPEGGTELRVRDSAKAPWRSLVKVGLEEQVEFVGFALDGKGAYLTTSVSADTSRVVEKNLKSGAERLLAQHPASDVRQVLWQPWKHALQAASFEDGGRLKWTAIEGSVKGDLEALAQVQDADLTVVSRDRADATWLVAFRRDNAPTQYFTWARAAKKATFLFSQQPKLDGAALASMKPVSIAARDGLALPAFLSLPPGAEPKGLPMVLLVHGGPWSADTWGMNGLVQLLANRGYAVLQVNFRGSTGYGKRFLNAGNREWGKKMHDDLVDAVRWAVAQGTVDPAKVCIMGGSYGGYAALAGAAFTPEVFRCAVDIVGPSNLFTLLRSLPPYWSALRTMFFARIGNPELPADEPLLRSASPLFAADRMRIPLLIGQGANDPRVKQAESEQIVAALEKAGRGVTYVLYPDEGHGFARPENRLDFFARSEAFLAQQLGGRVEPLPKEGRLPGASAVVKTVAPKAAGK